MTGILIEINQPSYHFFPGIMAHPRVTVRADGFSPFFHQLNRFVPHGIITEAPGSTSHSLKPLTENNRRIGISPTAKRSSGSTQAGSFSKAMENIIVRNIQIIIAA